MVQGVVEGVVEDVAPGGGRSGVGGLQGVDLLDGAVGVDDDGDDGRVAHRLGAGRHPEEQGDDLVEQPYGHGPFTGVEPEVEEADEPVAVGMRALRGGRERVVGVRQQEIHRRGFEGGQRRVDLGRVGVRVDHAEDSRVGVGTAAQHPQSGHGRRPGGAARVVDPAPVQCGGAAVQAHPDPYAGVGEPVHGALGEERAVGLHRGVNSAASATAVADRLAHRADLVDQMRDARQQRLTAVQIDLQGGESMGRGVLGDPGRGALHDVRRDPVGAVPPAAVGALVDVAVAAREIAAAVDLEDELPERHRPDPGPPQRRDVEFLKGPQGGHSW